MRKQKRNTDLRSLRIVRAVPNRLEFGSGKMPDLRVCAGYGIRSMPTASNLGESTGAVPGAIWVDVEFLQG